MELSTLEQQVMLAAMHLHPDAYGISVQDEIAARTKKTPPIGSVYAALERLERKGFMTSREGEPTAARGGRRKLYFEPTARGKHALVSSLQATTAMTRGLKLREASNGKTI